MLDPAHAPPPKPSTWPLWLLLVGAVSLPVAVYAWMQVQQQTAYLERLAQQAAVLDDLDGRVAQRLDQWDLLQARRVSTIEALKASGDVEPSRFLRSVSLEQQSMSRAQAELFLSRLYGDSGEETFVSVVLIQSAGPGHGLFALHRGDDRPDAVRLTVRADTFRLNAP
jgi:hypothetical protein